MKTPNSSPAFTNRQRRPADNVDHANPGTMSSATPFAVAKAKATAVKAAAIFAAYAAVKATADAESTTDAGWTRAAFVAYDAANAVYRTEYGFVVQDYPSANPAAYAALDLIFAPVK